ncbi:MAG: small multi-drug export protein [Candidatus Omnitrophica bacterium]|nr:small multi-drug export protein [Candidatus Omnitrophota bacterium]
MLEYMVNALKFFPVEWTTILIAASPVAELRGAIPVALALGQGVVKTYCLAVVGNIIPAVPLLLFFGKISDYLRRFFLWRKFFEWLFERTKRRADLVEKYGAIGLVLFVAIPLPMTGVWTGCIAAALFRIRFRYAIIAASIGVMIAGVAVTILSVLGIGLFRMVN